MWKLMFRRRLVKQSIIVTAAPPQRNLYSEWVSAKVHNILFKTAAVHNSLVVQQRWSSLNLTAWCGQEIRLRGHYHRRSMLFIAGWSSSSSTLDYAIKPRLCIFIDANSVLTLELPPSVRPSERGEISFIASHYKWNCTCETAITGSITF